MHFPDQDIFFLFAKLIFNTQYVEHGLQNLVTVTQFLGRTPQDLKSTSWKSERMAELVIFSKNTPFQNDGQK